MCIESDAVFVVFAVFFDAGWFAVSDHEYLFVGGFVFAEYGHGELQACDGVGVVGADLQVREVFELNWPGVVSEDDDIEAVFWVFSSYHFGKCHCYHFGGCDAVFAIEYHAMADVYHEDCSGLCFVFLLCDEEVVFGECEV